MNSQKVLVEVKQKLTYPSHFPSRNPFQLVYFPSYSTNNYCLKDPVLEHLFESNVCISYQAELDQYATALSAAGADLAPLNFTKKWK